jgi:protoporphyrinogen/coproporphyrinogen III oxidase
MSDTKQTTDVVIIGAGLTGLTTAYYLKKQGINVILLEKQNRTGGVIHTFQEDGFIFEAGPNTGVISYPQVTELFEELSEKCQLAVANQEAKKRLIWKAGQWHALPDGLLKAIKTPLFSTGDKFRILGEPFRKRGTNPLETVAELVLRRLGKSYLDYAVDPFISGIYAGNPANLVTRYALPKLYALEQNYGSFIRGSIKKSFEPKNPRMKKATREIFSTEHGLSSFIQALENSIGKTNITLNAENTIIQPQQGKYLISSSINNTPIAIETDHVISTIDAHSLTSLLPFLSSKDLSPISCMEYSKVTQVALGFKNWEGIEINAFGGLVPSKEKRDILGVLFISSFLNNRAPLKGALLSVFVGGTKRPELADLNDTQTKDLIFKEIKEMMGLKNMNPDLFRIFRYQRSIPQYEKSSKERLEAIDDIQRQYPGLFLAGGIRNGIGMGDRITQGKNIADQIVEKKRGQKT